MKLRMLAMLITGLMLVGESAIAAKDVSVDAQEVVRAFGDALKRNDVKAAREMALPIVIPITPDELDKKIAAMSKQMSADGAAWIVHEAHSDGSAAVVVVEQKSSKDARPDFDPLLLVERDGSLKVLLDDPEEHGIKGDELEACKKLLAWYKDEKKKRKQ